MANLLGHPENDFLNCGVAVAPVTDFRLYGEFLIIKLLQYDTQLISESTYSEAAQSEWHDGQRQINEAGKCIKENTAF